MLGLRALVSKTVSTTVPELLKQQTRNTFVLKRKWPPPLAKKGNRPSKLRGRHFVYDLLETRHTKKQPDLKVILCKYVEGVGDAGDIITMAPGKAYKNLLAPGLAVYNSPENHEKYGASEDKPRGESLFSSPYVPRTMGCLSRLNLQFSMSKSEPWTLEPWHVRASFRKAGFVVPESAIEMPPQKISGPDLSLQSKEFYVTVTINRKEKVNVRCRIHHWATGLERLPWEEHHWEKPREPLFPEQAEVLEKMPLISKRNHTQ